MRLETGEYGDAEGEEKRAGSEMIDQ